MGTNKIMSMKNFPMLSKTSSIICKEVFDDGYQPSTEEINEYASHIGINPKTETHLLYIAKEGLLQAIPSEWQICYNDECGGYYYYNTITKVRQWEHPLDAEYKSKVENIRKSYGVQLGNDFSEDTSQIDSGIKSLQGDDSDLLTDQSPLSSNIMQKMDFPLQNAGRLLMPLEKPIGRLAPIESVRNKRFEITNDLTDNHLPTAQIGLSIKTDGIQGASPKPTESNISSVSTFKGFTLSGKGSMFLKSTAKKSDAEDDTKSNGGTANSGRNFRSILRDSNATEKGKKAESKLTDFEIEDRKSVRFNLTKLAETGRGMYEGLGKSDESSNEEENIEWDLDDADGDENDDQDDGEESPPNLKLNEVDNINEGSTSGLINMFEKRNIETGQIKPLYEDTDSESVTSIRSAKNVRQIIEIDKELPKTTAMDTNPFRKAEALRSNKLDNNGEAVNVPHFVSRKSSKTELDLEVIKEDFEKKRQALEAEQEAELKTFKKELEERTNDRKIELESQHNVDVEKFKQQLNTEFEEKRKILMQGHRLAEERLSDDHKVILQELERDLKTEIELIKKDHATNLQQVKEQMKHELELERQRMRETGESHLYEKMRCEKRLLEDKYRCLKDKYGRLKSDVKLSIERRHQRNEQQSLTTGSETDRTNSNKHAGEVNTSMFESGDKRKTGKWMVSQKNPDQSSGKERVLDKMGKHTGATAKYSTQNQKPCTDDTSVSQSDTTISNNYQHNSRILMSTKATFVDNGNSDSEALQPENNNNYRESHERQRKKLFTRMKSASTSRLNSSNMKNVADLRPCTPVESLRRQLQKLDDLEDQFPDNTMDTTYHLRYPFSVEGNRERETSSTELEFFKHRIHLERDSVRRAKESLRVQKNNFRSRQREIKHRHRSATRYSLDQLIQEEKELTEMEVNLHRTRALLGEKVIRLRHLEQSLQRLCNEKPNFEKFNAEFNKDDTTISDLSSHSSSGFSSTDFASDTHQAHGQRRDSFHESAEIVQTLESLNNEIREIWNILSQQQTQGLTPPPSVLYQDMNWRGPLPISTLFPLNDALDETKNVASANALLCQPIPSLIDRLETYRQLASCRLSTGATDIANNLKTMPSEYAIQQSMQNCSVNLMERTQDLRNWLKKAKNEHELLRTGQQTDI